jgi:hypothetical protein
MGNTQTMIRISFEDMQTASKNPETNLIINTLPESEQGCLIVGTVTVEQELMLINRYLKENKNIRIILYGKNCNDETVQKKYQQLYTLGFINVYVYQGGLFEWLMLQDIYGKDFFQTTSVQPDLLRFKPRQMLNVSLLQY